MRISMVGLSRWESVFVQTSVDLASGMDIAPCTIVEDPQGADVLLVDAKLQHRVSYDGSDNRARPVVVSFTEDPETSRNARGLRRPVGYAELISMLKEIEEELHDFAAAVEPEEPEPASVPVVETPASVVRLLSNGHGRADEPLAERTRPARRFVEATRLLGSLTRISRWGIPAEITHARFPTLLIMPQHNTYVASGDPLLEVAMFRDSAMSFSIRDVADEVAETVLTSGKLRPLSHLIYCAALYGSEGRLMLNSNVQDRLSLIGTPNFDAVPHLTEHKTIANYLIDNAADLADISRATGVSMSIVIDFCNACEAAGLVRRYAGARGKHIQRMQ